MRTTPEARLCRQREPKRLPESESGRSLFLQPGKGTCYGVRFKSRADEIRDYRTDRYRIRQQKNDRSGNGEVHDVEIRQFFQCLRLEHRTNRTVCRDDHTDSLNDHETFLQIFPSRRDACFGEMPSTRKIAITQPVMKDSGGNPANPMYSALIPVSYTHLTLPTILLVQISVVAVSLKKKTTAVNQDKHLT
eukprot:TRINITY_DN10117_c0_g1_i6.p1 TRINITY_DN10117_c0_g1~~TRINITY_DN10117_c0_g1_i6.p1  ORF type:complete len:191 (+),score=24.53 TRINITY_DN10117_c0_g1_i6:688-1260(+)